VTENNTFITLSNKLQITGYWNFKVYLLILLIGLNFGLQII
jgi:hypothetical protein